MFSHRFEFKLAIIKTIILDKKLQKNKKQKHIKQNQIIKFKKQNQIQIKSNIQIKQINQQK